MELPTCPGCHEQFTPSARQLKRHRSSRHGYMTCGQPRCRAALIGTRIKPCVECKTEFRGKPAEICCGDACRVTRRQSQLIDRGVLKRCKRCGNPRIACGGCKLTPEEALRRERLRRAGYYEKHKERILEQQNEYRKQHAGDVAEQRRAAYRSDPTKKREQARSWYANNRERAKDTNRKYSVEHPEIRRRASRKYHLGKYGLTEESWSALFESQDRRCAVCGGTEPRHKNGWHTDHDHATGAVRGILCSPCNTSLGTLGDSVEGVLAAASAFLDYLERAANPSAVIAA